jgi:hypothetical protein
LVPQAQMKGRLQQQLQDMIAIRYPQYKEGKDS